MECKEQKELFGNEPNTVLIETLWNVKLCTDMEMRGVEIRFNRNIVECKERLSDHPPHTPFRFNRNIVECKGTCSAGMGEDDDWFYKKHCGL